MHPPHSVLRYALLKNPIFSFYTDLNLETTDYFLAMNILQCGQYVLYAALLTHIITSNNNGMLK